MTACHLKDQVSPYILTFAHSCNDLVVISHVAAKLRSQNRVNRLWRRSNLSMYQETYGSTYGPFMHANSTQDEKLDGWSIIGLNPV